MMNQEKLWLVVVLLKLVLYPRDEGKDGYSDFSFAVPQEVQSGSSFYL